MNKSLPNGQLVQGNEKYIKAIDGYSGCIPPSAFNALEREAAGLMHGTVTLIESLE